jgi:hypothetical protein
MPKIYLDMRAVLTQHSFHCCVDRGDEGVLLERDINLHVDVEGEIVRGWIHVHRKYTCSRAYLDPPPPPPPRRPLSSSEGEEDRSCQMATECWLGLLMGPDGNSTLRGRSWVSPGG